jgi:hypothetical protein
MTMMLNKYLKLSIMYKTILDHILNSVDGEFRIFYHTKTVKAEQGKKQMLPFF